MSQATGYTRGQIILHWLTVIAVLTAWFTHEGMEDIAGATWDAGGAPFPTIHTISGFLAFVFILIRLWLRSRSGASVTEGSGLQDLAAIWGHRALYALVLIVPLLGAATWFGGMRDLSEFHDLAGKALMLLALGHAGMAVWHQVIKKDGTLTKMLRAKS